MGLIKTIGRIERRRLPGLILAAVLALNIFISVRWLEHATVGWDALGYRIAAQQIARGEGPLIANRFNAQFGPYFSYAAFNVHRPQEPDRLYLNYPPGFPLLLALPQWLGWPDAVVLPLMSALSVLATFALGSLLVDRWTGVLGATIIGLTPAHLEWSTSFWADLPGAALALTALTIYLYADRCSRARQVVLGLAAGLLAAGAFFVKYAYVVMLLPLLIYALYAQRRSIFKRPVNWAFGATAALGLLGLAAYNQWLFGGPFNTYYTSPSAGFGFPQMSLSYALGPSPAGGYSLPAALETLWFNFGWILILSALGLRVVRGAPRLLLVSYALAFVALASVFAWAPRNEDTRYLVAAFAPIALLAAAGLRRLEPSAGAWRKPLFGVIIAALGVTLLASLWTTLPRLSARNAGSAQVLALARAQVSGSEPDAVFLAYLWNDPIGHAGQRTTLFYRRILGADDRFEQQLVEVVNGLLAEGTPVYYVADRVPPLRDSLAILQRHFEVRVWKPAPLAVFRVTPKS